MEQSEGHQPAALPTTRLPQPHDNPVPNCNYHPHHHRHHHHHHQPRPLHRYHPHAHPNHPQSTRPGSQRQQQQQRRHRLQGPGMGRSLPWAGLLLVLTLIAAKGGGVEASYERTCTIATRLRGPHRLGICGENIPQVLKLLCFSDGYNGYRGKREVGDVLGHEAAAAGAGATAIESEGATNIRDLLLNKQEAFTYLRSQRRAAGDGTLSRQRRHGNQGITCECCYNKCTVRELRQYCRRDGD